MKRDDELPLKTPRIHIVGAKNSGKTTLVVELVQELSSRGLVVATLKHTHHQYEFDVPNKDSFKHRQAGAEISGLIGPNMCAIYWDHSKKSDPRSLERFERVFSGCDLLIVEGDQHCNATKVEVWRRENSAVPIAATDSSVRAVITDDVVEVHCPVWRRSAVPKLATQLLTLIRS